MRQLPNELAAVDRLLTDPQLLLLFRQRWAELHAGQPPPQGRPTIPMATYLRVMVLKQRYGWGYETLLQEVSDSLHLRRFCLIPLVENVPHESTVRKLTRRLGADLVDELIRGLIEKALRERRFRPRALRADSTVAEADIRYPTDAGLCADAVKRLAREARKLRHAIPTVREAFRNRRGARRSTAWKKPWGSPGAWCNRFVSALRTRRSQIAWSPLPTPRRAPCDAASGRGRTSSAMWSSWPR